MTRTVILIVDDVAENLVAMQAALARPDRELLLARSAKDALDCLLERDIALVLLDVQMPGMDGFELARLIQGVERTASIPLIFLTAGSSDPIRTALGYRSGAVDFLYKPIDPDVLESKVSVFVELHEQRRKLAARLDELDHALRMNELFAAVLGHDLRNPLAAIAAGAEILLRDPDSPAVTDIAFRIKSSSTRMTHMVERLLDAARMRAGTLAMTFDEVDLADVAHSIVDEFDQPDSTGRIRIDTRGSTTLRADVGAVGQILSNLIGNALRHGEPGEPVFVDLDGSEPHEVHFAIRNTGCLPDGLCDVPFKAFLNARGTEGSGTGLGLYIVNQLVALHQGKLDLHSDPDSGTVVRCTLHRRLQ